jgi:hypothetical protein
MHDGKLDHQSCGRVGSRTLFADEHVGHLDLFVVFFKVLDLVGAGKELYGKGMMWC